MFSLLERVSSLLLALTLLAVIREMPRGAQPWFGPRFSFLLNLRSCLMTESEPDLHFNRKMLNSGKHLLWDFFAKT